MSNFLDNLTARSLNNAEVVQPRLPSLFETPRIVSSLAALHTFEPTTDEETASQIAGDATWSDEQSDNPGAARPILNGARGQSNKIDERFAIDGRHAHDAEHSGDQPGSVFAETVKTLPLPTNHSPATTAGRGLETEPRLHENTANEVRQSLQSRPPLLPDASLNPAEQMRASQAKRAGETHPENKMGSEQENGSSQPRSADSQDAKFRVSPVANRKPTEAISTLRPLAPDQGLESLTSPATMRPAIARTRARESSPTIKITIGRVEVRAVMPAQLAQRTSPASKKTALSLDEYLKQRSGGRR